MKCANHPLVDATAYCGQCGRSLCNDCKREVRGMIYCEACLASRLTGSVLGPTTGPSPGVALALGFIPGVGAAYNGQVAKGLVQVLIFITLWALAQRVDALGWAVAAFWVYLVIDSYQTAKAKCAGQPAPEWFGLGELKMTPPIGAGILIALGGLFLLDNLGIHVFRQVDKFWPVLLIAVGLLILQRRMSGGRRPPPPMPPSGPGPSGGTGEGPTNIPGPQGL
jgi:hypothetical protein